MLIVRAVEDIPTHNIRKGDEFRLYIVDAHHHMGKEGSHRNTPAGAYDFYAQLWFEIQKQTKQMLDDDALLFEPVNVVGPDLPSRCFRTRDSWNRLDHGWLVDRTVVFPYTDDYSVSENRNEASFKVSNDKIAGWTTRAPHSTRLIGFARVDPMDESVKENLAVDELERSILELGLRGLKLHPLAQLFVESIEGEQTRSVVTRAGELGIPVIFDTRNISTVLRIRNLVDSIRNDPECGTAIRGLRVILAHCGMSPGDSRLYDVLRDPAIFIETSTLHDLDVPVLFESAKDRLGRVGAYWSEKILFGTDFSFLSIQAVDIVMYLLSREFSGTLGDMQRILGGNALSLIQRPYSTANKPQINPQDYITIDRTGSGQLRLEDSLLSLISKNEWDLCSLDFMLPPNKTWPEPRPISSGGFNGIYLDSYVLTLRKKSNGKELHVWIRRGPDQSLHCSLLSTVGMSKLDTMENASQKINPILQQFLKDHQVILPSVDAMAEMVIHQIK
ncbi:MAG: amidohydrolase family protein [Candidatus Thorarchaeota archaeon]|nr:amidohydrolase family protein [Candidatus Thorarchaeota archaeon]